MSSSDRPSEKYSWSFFSLISTNGSTAMDLSPSGLAAGRAAISLAGSVAVRYISYPTAATTITATNAATATPVRRRRRNFRSRYESLGGRA